MVVLFWAVVICRLAQWVNHRIIYPPVKYGRSRGMFALACFAVLTPITILISLGVAVCSRYF